MTQDHIREERSNEVSVKYPIIHMLMKTVYRNGYRNATSDTGNDIGDYYQEYNRAEDIIDKIQEEKGKKIVTLLNEALKGQKLSESTWKKIASVNRVLLDGK